MNPEYPEWRAQGHPGPNAFRSLAGTMRHGPDRLLHPARRKRALARLRTEKPPGTILVVCHGNICRSPYAAAVLTRLLPARSLRRFRIHSAGFVSGGRASPTEAIAVAARRGLDLANHRSTCLTPEMVAEAALIVVMNAQQRSLISRRYGRPRRDVLVLGDLDPQSIRKRAILDPFAGSFETFEMSYGRIDRCIETLVRALPSDCGSPMVQP